MAKGLFLISIIKQYNKQTKNKNSVGTELHFLSDNLQPYYIYIREISNNMSP